MMNTVTRMSRRDFFAKLGKGSLAVGFSLSPAAAALFSGEARAATVTSELSVLSGAVPDSDAWITIDSQGTVTLFSGKVELGTGVETAFTQIVAEELYVSIAAVQVIQGDTEITPDQGFTAGSKSVQVQGPLVRRAAATAFQQLLQLAAAYFGVSASQLVASNGSIGIGPSMKRATSYPKLFSGQQLDIATNPSAPVKDPSAYTIVSQPVPRVDLPAKFTGTFTYVSDVVVPNMLHGRVVRVNGATSKPKNATFGGYSGTSYADTLAVPGVVQVVQQGNFVGVVATTEWAAIVGARTLKPVWNAGAALVSDFNQGNLEAALKDPMNIYATSSQQTTPGDTASAYAGASTQASRTYYTPYQMHGAVGPNCAVASVTATPDANGIQATVWSGTQGVYQLRQAISDIIGLPTTAIHVIYVEGAGCYGHNGADDAAADAAVMSRIVGQPVRVQWMRQDEHGWEPLGPAMAHELKGGVTGSSVVSWEHTLYSPPHSSRPGGGGSLLAGQETGLHPPNLPTAPVNLGTRNAPVNYNFPALKLTANHVQPFDTAGGVVDKLQPLVNTLPRSSALRSLGGMSNTFANESFMDELAAAAGQDPIAFREAYVCMLSGGSGTAQSLPLPLPSGYDSRAVAALEAVRVQSGWENPLTAGPPGTSVGKGVAYARYETVETYVCAYVEVEVTNAGPAKGSVKVRRVVVAHDCGLIINPDGLRNQIEGNVIQGISRALIEEVGFNTSGVTSLLWASQSATPPAGTTYPVIHFNQVPASIEIVLINHPDQLTQAAGNVPAWGAGEPMIGVIPPAIANAIFNAVGARATSLPMTATKVAALF